MNGSMNAHDESGRDWPELAVVVLAVGAPRELTEAVASVVGQRPRPEVVVVSSGGGDAAGLLASHGIMVPVVASPRQLPTGAARNEGVAATRAPFVAFLAVDCRADRGWVAARLAAHRAGAPAVASALINPYPASLAACTAYLSLHVRRWPNVPEGEAQRYGVSYSRELLARYGGFRGAMARGEDTELHARFAPPERPRWDPAVRTAHLYPRSLPALVADHWRRGARTVESYAALGGAITRATIARRVLVRPRDSFALAWRITPASGRPRLAATLAYLPLATLAYAAGALGAPHRRPQ